MIISQKLLNQKMKKLTMNKHLAVLALIALMIIMASCNDSNKAEVDRAIQVFFLGVIEVINMLLFGIVSVVFCVLSVTSPKPAFKILGWIFLSIFFLFTMIIFVAVLDHKPKNPQIFFVFLIAFGMKVVSLVFAMKKSKHVIQKNNADLLDKSEEDII